MIAEFSRYIANNNIHIPGIKGIFSHGEVLKERELISQAFNAPVYNQYGSSEVPCIAHECPKGNMHMNFDEILIEFADINNSSDLKKIIITPLYLYGMPLLRYDLNDIGSSIFKKCDCGLPYPVMELKIGRVSDNFILPDGKMVSGITFGWYFANATQEIKKYQIIQNDYTDFTVKIVSNPEVKIQNEEKIRTLMTEMLRNPDLTINFEYYESIPHDNSGKYRMIISKIADNKTKITK